MRNFSIFKCLVFIFILGIACENDVKDQIIDDDTKEQNDSTSIDSTDTVIDSTDVIDEDDLSDIPVDTVDRPAEVTSDVMQQIYDEVKTPYKYGLVLAADDKKVAYDCPTVFKKDGKYYMSFIVYDAHEARGYETMLAESEDLLNWTILGNILSFSDDDVWDKNQKAGYLSLINYEWGGDNNIETYKDKYWMSYFGGSSSGCEKGTLSLGIAFTSQEPVTAHEWDRNGSAVLTPDDDDARDFEAEKLYKSTVIRDKEGITAHRFVMFYNAADATDAHVERIGMAISNNMINWERYGGDGPVLGRDIGITGDPVIQKIDNVYVMFFYALWHDSDDIIFNTFACSYDLVNWTVWDGDVLVVRTTTTGSFDKQFAHKPYVIKENGVVYHFYCAVNKAGCRGLAVATSADLGTSSVSFVE